jgi:hypothetical protein
MALPSKTSGASTLSGFRCFVKGTSSETCTKLTRDVRYAILLDILVRSCANTKQNIFFRQLSLEGGSVRAGEGGGGSLHFGSHPGAG